MAADTPLNLHYRAAPTLAAFHASPAFVRGVMGPVGSGKSTAMCMELMRRACAQAPGPDGVRRTRFAVIRNTLRELRDTALRTWLDWFPESAFGEINRTDMRHTLRFEAPDGGGVETEILFRALDAPGDVKKLLSLELTGAWVNEAREIPKAVVDALGDRVGRFPPVRLGGCAWSGVVMDTNPPDDGHWWFRLAEVERPGGWAFFRQPGGLVERGKAFVDNPEAENLANLPPGYYRHRALGKSAEHVRVYYCAQYGFVSDGKPIFPEYVDTVHCAEGDLAPVPDTPLVVGIDFGLTPAALIAQRLASGRWLWLDELVCEDMGAVRFGGLLKAKLGRDYPGYAMSIWGDPAGEQRAQTDERTPFQILRALGVPALPAPSNDFTLRREAVASALSRLVDGLPGLTVSPRCAVARKGLAGGYCFARTRCASGERFTTRPDKSRFSHVVEAGGYAMLGAGEGAALIRARPGGPRFEPRQTRADHGFSLGPDGRNQRTPQPHGGRP